jgi:hypothetical protein
LSPTRHKDKASTLLELPGLPPRPPTALPCPAQPTSTTFRGRRPNIVPLTLELQLRTTWNPTALTEQDNHSQTMAATPKSEAAAPTSNQPPPLECIDRVENPAAPAVQGCHSNHAKEPPFLIGPLSHVFPRPLPRRTSLNHPELLPRHPPTTGEGDANVANATQALQSYASKKVML